VQAEIWRVWLAALITLGIYSFLYSDNRLYRVLLNAMIGLGAGYGFIIAWKNVLGPKWFDPMWAKFGEYQQAHAHMNFFSLLGEYIVQHWTAFIYFLVLGILGSFWYFQFSKKNVWLSRIVIGMTMGAGAGVVFKSQFLLNMPQITDSIRPLIARQVTETFQYGSPLIGGTGGIDIWTSLNNIVYLSAIVSVMVYFFFSFSHDNPIIVGTAKYGRWMLMISFGAFFGNTIMTRMAVFLQRLQFLSEDWAPRYVASYGFYMRSFGYACLLAAVGVVGYLLIATGGRRALMRSFLGVLIFTGLTFMLLYPMINGMSVNPDDRQTARIAYWERRDVFDANQACFAVDSLTDADKKKAPELPEPSVWMQPRPLFLIKDIDADKYRILCYLDYLALKENVLKARNKNVRITPNEIMSEAEIIRIAKAQKPLSVQAVSAELKKRGQKDFAEDLIWFGVSPEPLRISLICSGIVFVLGMAWLLTSGSKPKPVSGEAESSEGSA